MLNETVEDDEKQNLPEDWEEGAYHGSYFIVSFFIQILLIDLNSCQFIDVPIWSKKERKNI